MDSNNLLLAYNKPEANNSKAMQAYNALDADYNALDADYNTLDTDNNALDADNNAVDADNNASKKGCGGHCQPTIA